MGIDTWRLAFLRSPRAPPLRIENQNDIGLGALPNCKKRSEFPKSAVENLQVPLSRTTATLVSGLVGVTNSPGTRIGGTWQ
jgi:hypothetical protein